MIRVWKLEKGKKVSDAVMRWFENEVVAYCDPEHDYKIIVETQRIKTNKGGR